MTHDLGDVIAPARDAPISTSYKPALRLSPATGGEWLAVYRSFDGMAVRRAAYDSVKANEK